MARGSRLVHLNGQLVEAGEASLSALSPALSHGPIIFETMRGYWNGEQQQLFLFRVADHLRRLTASARILRFEEIPPIDVVRDHLLELVRANGLKEDIHIRILVFPQGRDEERAIPTRPTTLITTAPCRSGPAAPISCQVSSWRRPGDDSLPSRVKSVGGRIFAQVANAQARADGYEHAILLSERGKLAEGVASNIMLVRFGVAVTPRISDSILEGLTRATLISLLREGGIPFQEREVDRSELYDCDEAFLCSTLLEILPIGSVDRVSVAEGSEGPLTRKLRELYGALVRGDTPQHTEWRTAVY